MKEGEQRFLFIGRSYFLADQYLKEHWQLVYYSFLGGSVLSQKKYVLL